MHKQALLARLSQSDPRSSSSGGSNPTEALHRPAHVQPSRPRKQRSPKSQQQQQKQKQKQKKQQKQKQKKQQQPQRWRRQTPAGAGGAAFEHHESQWMQQVRQLASDYGAASMPYVPCAEHLCAHSCSGFDMLAHPRLLCVCELNVNPIHLPSPPLSLSLSRSLSLPRCLSPSLSLPLAIPLPISPYLPLSNFSLSLPLSLPLPLSLSPSLPLTTSPPRHLSLSPSLPLSPHPFWRPSHVHVPVSPELGRASPNKPVPSTTGSLRPRSPVPRTPQRWPDSRSPPCRACAQTVSPPSPTTWRSTRSAW